MSARQTSSEVLARWTDVVAAGITAAVARLASPRVVRLVEQDGEADTFALQGDSKGAVGGAVTFANGQFSGRGFEAFVKGNRMELVLRQNRFLVRPLELPARAAEFIEGIVREQIDRLTPWGTSEAVFGCSEPVDAGSGNIKVTIAATARAATEPYLAGLAALNPTTISIFTLAGEEARDLIRVFEQRANGLLDRARLSRLLRLTLAVTVTAAALSTLGGWLIGNYLDSQRTELDGKLTARRIALQLDRKGAELSPLAVLARRKHERQASVIAIEELSRIVPDNTYLTELHIDGNTLQIAGVTSDAPSLIRLMERSQHFSRATFFAPTTRAPSETGDRFHIEAKLESINTVSR
jgi:general secretion pathway protein L